MKHWKQTIYAVPVEADNIRQVQEMTREDYLREYWADECNTPNGTKPRLFVRETERTTWLLPDGVTFDTANGDTAETVEEYVEAHNEEEGTGGDTWPDDVDKYAEAFTEWELCRWQPNGRARVIETYTTEEEAEHELLLLWENASRTESKNAPTLCETMDEARELIAERRNIPRDVNIPRPNQKSTGFFDIYGREIMVGDAVCMTAFKNRYK